MDNIDAELALQKITKI